MPFWKKLFYYSDTSLLDKWKQNFWFQFIFTKKEIYRGRRAGLEFAHLILQQRASKKKILHNHYFDPILWILHSILDFYSRYWIIYDFSLLQDLCLFGEFSWKISISKDNAKFKGPLKFFIFFQHLFSTLYYVWSMASSLKPEVSLHLMHIFANVWVSSNLHRFHGLFFWVIFHTKWLLTCPITFVSEEIPTGLSELGGHVPIHFFAWPLLKRGICPANFCYQYI